MAGESSLKKRSVTLDPLSPEWIKRKPVPFGEKHLGNIRTSPRPDYTADFKNGGEPIQIRSLGLASKQKREAILRDSLKTPEEARARVFVVVVPNQPMSRREIMEEYLSKYRKKDLQNFAADMGTLTEYADILEKLVGGRVYAL